MIGSELVLFINNSSVRRRPGIAYGSESFELFGRKDASFAVYRRRRVEGESGERDGGGHSRVQHHMRVRTKMSCRPVLDSGYGCPIMQPSKDWHVMFKKIKCLIIFDTFIDLISFFYVQCNGKLIIIFNNSYKINKIINFIQKKHH